MASSLDNLSSEGRVYRSDQIIRTQVNVNKLPPCYPGLTKAAVAEGCLVVRNTRQERKRVQLNLTGSMMTETA
jgi:hypothetical protein